MKPSVLPADFEIVPAALYYADPQRQESMVSSYGDWKLTEQWAAAFGSSVGHVLWCHATGELALVGARPEAGIVDLDAMTGQVKASRFMWRGLDMSPVSTSAGAPWDVGLPTEIIPVGTKVCVLANIAHHWDVGTALWGWHLHHRKDEGLTWLLEAVAQRTSESFRAQH